MYLVGKKIQFVLDLEGRKVAVFGGSVNLCPEGLKDLITRFGIQVMIMEMDSYNQVFEALDKGDVDAGVAPTRILDLMKAISMLNAPR